MAKEDLFCPLKKWHFRENQEYGLKIQDHEFENLQLKNTQTRAQKKHKTIWMEQFPSLSVSPSVSVDYKTCQDESSFDSFQRMVFNFLTTYNKTGISSTGV